MNLNKYFKAFHEIKSPIRFKESVQKYELNIFRNLSKFDETKLTLKGKSFTIHERGKVREITATPISQRPYVHCLCKELFSQLKPYLFYDNGASQKGKGIDFTRKRFEIHLHRFYRKYKDGYILKGDFSKFFDSVDHETLLNELKNKINVYYINIIRNILKEHNDSGKSVDIGSELSQIMGIFYCTKFDNFIKIVKSVKFYGRYMDDFYIIHHDKEFLKNLLKELKIIAEELKLKLNLKKTKIIKLHSKFTFLQVKYFLTNTGKLIKSPISKFFKREIVKLRKLQRLNINTLKQFKSWYGMANRSRVNTYHRLPRELRIWKTKLLLMERNILNKKLTIW